MNFEWASYTILFLQVSAAESNDAEGASVDLAEHPGHIDNSTLFVAASGTKNDNDSRYGHYQYLKWVAKF